MSVSGISFGGLASGLNTQAILSALLTIEQRPITALENKKRSFQGQLSLFGELETKLGTLRDKVDDVRQSANFLEFEASLNRTDFLTASASSSAIAGSYSIIVHALAKPQSNQSNSYASDTTPVITGNSNSRLEFDFGGNNTVTVDLTNPSYSLQEVASAINAVGQDISAQVVKVADADYRLVVNGPLGAAGAFSVKGFGHGSVKDLGKDLDQNLLVNAQDAEVDINGLVIRRESNSFSDAITGVTINLVSANSSESSQLTVTPDASATADKVQSMVDAYNSVIDFMKAQNVLDEEGKAQSELFGDSTLRTVRSLLRSVAGASSTLTNSEPFNLLSQVGIDADSQGRLTFDRSEFEAAVAADDDAVEALFTGSIVPANPTAGTPEYGGIASRLYQLADDLLDTVDGVLVARKNGFNTRIKDVNNQIENAERRLERKQAALELKFANLEVLLGQLQSQGAALGGLPSPFTGAS